VDIDESLISLAWRRRRTAWSLQEPGDHLEDDASESAISEEDAPLKKRKRSEDKTISDSGKLRRPLPDFFPMSCEHEFGSLPVPPSEIRGKYVFPHNLVFVTADWVNSAISDDIEGYDIVIGCVEVPTNEIHDSEYDYYF
jgi:hypothetical protein